MALLDADVNFKVAKQFIEDVKKAIGQKVIQSIHGSQSSRSSTITLVELLGSTHASEIDPKPSSIMMVGLHGAGKTT